MIGHGCPSGQSPFFFFIDFFFNVFTTMSSSILFSIRNSCQASKISYPSPRVSFLTFRLSLMSSCAHLQDLGHQQPMFHVFQNDVHEK